MNTDTSAPGIGEQMHYITVDNPRRGTKVVSLVHPPTSQALDISAEHSMGEHSIVSEQREFTSQEIYMGEDGEISVHMKQEVEDEPQNNGTIVAISDPATQDGNQVSVTITDPSTNEDVVLPMATSALDALLAVGMEQGQQETVVETVVEDANYVAETVEVQVDNT